VTRWERIEVGQDEGQNETGMKLLRMGTGWERFEVGQAVGRMGHV
jgi:hypothetical protein